MLEAIQNNNVGNIRFNPSNNWVGQIGVDYRGFVIFDTLYNGCRAMMKLIFNYINQGYNTISKIITKYAPSNENDTTGYINFVSNHALIGKYDTLQISNRGEMLALIDAMILMETGEQVEINFLATVYNHVLTGSVIVEQETTNLFPVLVSSLLVYSFIKFKY